MAGRSDSPPAAFWPRSALLPPAAGISTSRSYYCQACQLSCTGPMPWKQHQDSAKHLKMAARFASLTGHSAAASGISTDTVGSVSSRPYATSDSPRSFSPAAGGSAGPYFCDVCQLACTGPAPWRQHMESAKHMKKASQAGRAPTQGSAVQLPYRSGATHSVDDVLRSGDTPDRAWPVPAAVGGPAGSYFCDLCRLPCSGPEPWREHLNSAKHIKRASQAGRGPAEGMTVGRASPGSSQHSFSSDGDEHYSATADASPQSFSPAVGSYSTAADASPRPFSPPMGSYSTPTDASPRSFSPAVGSYSTAADASPRPSFSSGMGAAVTGGAYFCEFCQLSCSGPEPWKQHTESAKHIKKASDAGRRSTAPGNVSSLLPSSTVPPDVNVPRVEAVSDSVGLGQAVSAHSSPSHSVPSVGYLTTGAFFCDLCQLSCSGPEPWKQHTESAKHIKKASDAGRLSTAPGNVSSLLPSSAVPPDVNVPRSPGDVADASFVSVPVSDSGQSVGQSVLPDAVGATSSYYCGVCRLECTGPEPFRQHMDSAKHSKMVTSQERMRNPGVFSGFPPVCSPPARAAPPAAAAIALPSSSTSSDSDSDATDRPPLPVPVPAELAAVCRAIRLGSWLHHQLDGQDGISENDTLSASQHLKTLHVEGLVAFLEDTPLVRTHQPFSRTRC